MPSSNTIEQLLSARGDLWRGRQRPPAPSISTGRVALDQQLPGGGWPRGKLIELLPERVGVGELELLLPCLAEQTRRGLPVLFLAPPLIPCPQSLVRHKLDLTRLLIVREPKYAFWAAEQCLKSGLCGAIVAWPASADVRERSVRRLQLAAENGQAPVFLCYAPGCKPPASLAALRLAIRSGGALDVLRGRRGESPDTIRLNASNVVSLTARACS